MPWPLVTAPPQCLAPPVEAEMGSITRNGASPPLNAGRSAPCLTSAPRSLLVGKNLQTFPPLACVDITKLVRDLGDLLFFLVMSHQLSKIQRYRFKRYKCEI